MKGKFKLTLLLFATVALVGCAGLTQGIKTARTAVNGVFDTAEKVAAGAEKATASALGTASATATAATASSVTPPAQ